MNYFSALFLSNSPWLWLILTVIFIVIEAITFSLTTVWFAGGALVLVFLSFFPIPFRWQILIFAVVSFTLLIFTRPFVVKKLRIKSVPMNSDGLIGKKVLVNEKISELEKGSVKVNGVVWSARTSDGSALEAGCECVIEAIEGATLVVSRPK